MQLITTSILYMNYLFVQIDNISTLKSRNSKRPKRSKYSDLMTKTIKEMSTTQILGFSVKWYNQLTIYIFRVLSII